MDFSQLEAIYRTYDQALAQANRKASIFTGLLGQGHKDDPRNDACNKTFYESTGNWVKTFAETGPDQDDILHVCRFLTEAASRRAKMPTYWYTLVAQGYMKDLIPLLNPENRALLAKEYDTLYPKRRRLPIQDEIYRMLSA